MKEDTPNKIAAGAVLALYLGVGIYLAPEVLGTRDYIDRIREPEKKELVWLTGKSYEELLAENDHKLTLTLLKADLKHKYLKQRHPDTMAIPYHDNKNEDKLKRYNRVFDASDMLITDKQEPQIIEVTDERFK